MCLLNPETGEVLQTDPGQYGLLSSNSSDERFSFITIPKSSLDAINRMELACEKSVYIAALALVSKARNEVVAVDRQLWQQLAHLGRNAFGRGFKRCKNKKLFSYKRGILTLHDPLTGAPSERWRSPQVWIDHDNPKWKYDLNKITPEQWHAVVEKLLHQTFPDVDGWTPTEKEVHCPFCKQYGEFSVNFNVSGYRCHGCGEKGRLGQLVKQVRGTNMDAAKQFIQETIENMNEKEILV